MDFLNERFRFLILTEERWGGDSVRGKRKRQREKTMMSDGEK